MPISIKRPSTGIASPFHNYYSNLTAVSRSIRTSCVFQHLTKKMADFQFALSEEIYPACAFEQWPCANHSYIIEISKIYSVLIELTKPNGQANGNFSFLPATNNSNALDMVCSGQADFSDYMIKLNSLSVLKCRNLGPLFPSKTMFTYKDINSIEPSIDIFEMFPWKLHALILLTVAIFWTLRQLNFPTVHRVLKRASPVSGIMVSIFFAYLSSEVVLLFNRNVTQRLPMTNFESVMERVACGDYRLAFTGQNGQASDISDWARRRSQNLYQRIQNALKFNPPITVATGELLADEILSAKGIPIVGISNSIWTTDMMNHKCGLTYVQGDSGQKTYYTMFVRDGLDHQRLTENHRAVLQSEFGRVARQLYPAKMCYATGLPSALAYQPLGMHQLEIVFYIVLLICSFGGTVVVIGERFTRLLNSGREKRKILTDKQRLARSP